ncbi:hypothetical protein LIER_04223 [Lithospermum erythrorhizon]|uniref:Uncharacterized protein n=1 Tax=Lithospermum erythrorhizon TaxID=34254 RepID=A0AAV3NXJ6_LITER
MMAIEENETPRIGVTLRDNRINMMSGERLISTTNDLGQRKANLPFRCLDSTISAFGLVKSPFLKRQPVIQRFFGLKTQGKFRGHSRSLSLVGTTHSLGIPHLLGILVQRLFPNASLPTPSLNSSQDFSRGAFIHNP